MTPLVCIAPYRAPELLPATVTAEALDMIAEPRGGEKYGAAVDVWSFGAVLCELLTGQPLVRASSGAGLVRCLLQRLGPCPCDTDGCPRRLPAYLASGAWAALRKAASDRPMCREAWPWPADDARGGVLDACLQWRPSQRPSMSTLIRMPWFQPKTAAAEPPRTLLPCLDAGGSHQRGGWHITDQNGAAGALCETCPPTAWSCARPPPPGLVHLGVNWPADLQA